MNTHSPVTARFARWLIPAAIAAQALLGAPDPIAEGFKSPPDAAKPHTWWHWMNGNISREGITADLEAMKRVGLGGAQIFNVGSGIPAGPVVFMSPEWREMMKHAVREADRLGLELCLHNCAGWSSSGGPWNTPANAMQAIVSSEVRVEGGKRFSGRLPQPATRLDHYRDIAVLAFPAEPGIDWVLKERSPKITASAGKIAGAKLVDGSTEGAVTLPLPTAGNPVWVELEFAEPVEARTAVLGIVGGMNGTKGTIGVSDDGRSFRKVRDFTLPRSPGGVVNVSLGEAAVKARWFRVTLTVAGAKTRRIALTEIGLTAGVRLEELDARAGFSEEVVAGAPLKAVPPGLAVPRDRIIDLTGSLRADGTLDWEAPAGSWIVQRIGHTPTGRNNHPAPEGGLGPECDKMSKEAFDAHWAGMMQKIIDDVGPLAGKTLKMALIDSYEVGGQNWTPRFREEFLRRRGYDLLRFLPAISGRVVDTPEITERFLWDVRRTVADLFAENYFGHFAKVCHDRGMLASIEPYGGPFEALQSGAPADVPMGEFWVGGNSHMSVKLAASVAHIYGRTFVAAEAFTAKPPNFGRWQEDPYALKTVGDLVFSQGVNRLVFHRYAHQPWMNRLPGMTMGQWGTHFDRTNTWWEQGRAWVSYLARCQYLLQRGRFVADVAIFSGEGSPATTLPISPALPPGYDSDSINADVLLNRTAVRDGRLAVKDGPEYRLLVLPPNVKTMTPALLQRLRTLVEAGMVLVGEAPLRSPSLQGQPAADAEVAELARTLWGAEAGVAGAPVDRKVGRGRVVRGKAAAEVLRSLNVYPDFEYASETAAASLVHLHRVDGGADFYFVSNQRRSAVEAEVSLRAEGRVPELFDAETGSVREAPLWKVEGGRTKVRLALSPAGSVFVVLRKPVPGAGGAGKERLAEARLESENADASARQPGKARLEIVTARYESVEGEGGMDAAPALAALAKGDTLRAEVANKTFGRDPTPNQRKQLRVEYRVDGKSKTVVVPENGFLEIVPDDEAGGAPRLELAREAGGRTWATVWEAGSQITWRSQAGKAGVTRLPAAPAMRALEGPWTVAFPSGWDAPASVAFPELASWTEQADKGIRYFSGTATYRKAFDLPAEWLAPGRSLALDLGRVKNLAEVSLNGKPLGILWKPPFRVLLDGAAVAGRNVLEVRVTNQWVNRLIGDEQLPPDCEWSGLQLKALPEWLTQGKPSPTGRKTFTTWHHWTKDMQPLESGLLGPVMLRAGVRVELR